MTTVNRNAATHELKETKNIWFFREKKAMCLVWSYRKLPGLVYYWRKFRRVIKIAPFFSSWIRYLSRRRMHLLRIYIYTYFLLWNCQWEIFSTKPWFVCLYLTFWFFMKYEPSHTCNWSVSKIELLEKKNI